MPSLFLFTKATVLGLLSFTTLSTAYSPRSLGLQARAGPDLHVRDAGCLYARNLDGFHDQGYGKVYARGIAQDAYNGQVFRRSKSGIPKPSPQTDGATHEAARKATAYPIKQGRPASVQQAMEKDPSQPKVPVGPYKSSGDYSGHLTDPSLLAGHLANANHFVGFEAWKDDPRNPFTHNKIGETPTQANSRQPPPKPANWNNWDYCKTYPPFIAALLLQPSDVLTFSQLDPNLRVVLVDQ